MLFFHITLQNRICFSNIFLIQNVLLSLKNVWTYLDNNILSKLPFHKVWRKLRHENFKKYKQKGYHYFTHLKTFCSFLKPSLIYQFPYNILHQTKTVFDGQNYAFDNLSCINDFPLHKKMRNDWQWVEINSEGDFLFSCACIFTRILWK